MMLSSRLLCLPAQNPRLLGASDLTGMTGTLQTRVSTAKIINLLPSRNRSTFRVPTKLLQ